MLAGESTLMNQLIRTPACHRATKGMNKRKREHTREIELDQSPKAHHTVLKCVFDCRWDGKYHTVTVVYVQEAGFS